MPSPQMKESQRAVQLWSLLVLAERNQHILSYTTVHLNGYSDGRDWWLSGSDNPLLQEQKPPLPWLTSLVVNEETGLPGEGFMEAAKREYGDRLDVHAMQSRVFIYDWFELMYRPSKILKQPYGDGT